MHIISSMKYFLRSLFIFLLVAALYSCGEEPLTAQQIIDKSIEAYGGKRVYTSDIEFDFRDIHYRNYTNWGELSYERTFVHDSLGNIHDVLNNEGFKRMIEGDAISLNEEWIGKYSRSVNSVVYFFRIPFNLNDEAVNKKLLPEAEINGKQYFKIHVSFDQEGGGDDYDDYFVYWVNKDSYIIDYFAYSYSTDGGGKRFREMMNLRNVNGLQVVDYINYKPKILDTPLETFDDYFQEGGMDELSRIENKNVVVKYLE